jgi:hypothetical protein
MSKAIIRDYLLVSGKSRRPDLAKLGRDCRERGFSFDHTGKFGIGVLSYFMLADKVVIRTRRNVSEDREPHGWRFETDGIGAFGELCGDEIGGGTEVTLRLKREIYAKQLDQMVERHFSDDLAGREWTRENWGKMEDQMLALQISEYLRNNLTRVPCAFAFRLIGLNELEIACGPGPSADATADDRRDLKMLEITGGPGWMRSEQKARELLGDQVAADAPIRFEWCTGKLTEDAGDYRLGLPYFDLPGGASLTYFEAVGELGNISLATGKIDPLHLQPIRFAWKGMAVRPSGAFDAGDFGDLASHVSCEVDWRSESVGKISVNRADFQFGSDLYSVHRESLLGAITEFVKHWLRQNATSDYHLLNCHLAGFAVESTRTPSWIFRDGDAIRLRPIPIPATMDKYCPSEVVSIHAGVVRDYPSSTEPCFWGNLRVTVLESVGPNLMDSPATNLQSFRRTVSLPCCGRNLPPSRCGPLSTGCTHKMRGPGPFVHSLRLGAAFAARCLGLGRGTTLSTPTTRSYGPPNPFWPRKSID